MRRNQTVARHVVYLTIAGTLVWCAAAHGQAWISFVEDPSRISADPSVINDLPCDPSCTQTCDSGGGAGCDNVCACACEKDMAVGDLDGDPNTPGGDDLVIVRIQPFYSGAGVSNLLFLNENGVMVDRSDLVEGFADQTQDRDVVIVDVDPIVGSSLNMPDVVTATTNGDQPRVYINLGCCSTACSPSSPCMPANKVGCTDSGSTNWCGLKYDASENRIPAFTPGPKFCGVAAGDLNNDDCRDLYFTDYDNTLEDRLLFNGKDPQTGACTGFFTDVTTSPSTRLCPNGPPCFYEVLFGTGVQIVDVDLDGFNDIVKTDAIDDDTSTNNGELIILYNDDTDPGHFNVKHLPQEGPEPEFNQIDTPYMFAAGDMNNDGGIDVYVVRTKNAVADRFIINKCFQADPLPPECDRGDGTVQFDLPRSVKNTSRTDYPGGNVALIDLDGDTVRDVLLADVDVPGSFCNNTLRLLQTTVDPLDPLNVKVREPIGGAPSNDGNCAWNTNRTYDFAVLDINGDTKPDLWSGHDEGNQVFLWEAPSDCDGDSVPDRCNTASGPNPGTENAKYACCQGPFGKCSNKFEPCCAQAGGIFFPGETCPVMCPTQQGPTPGP